MRFGFTSSQLELQTGLRDVLRRTCTPDVVRAAWEDGHGPVPGLWTQLGEIGLLGLLASEEAGGMGCSEVELVLLLEECGRFAVPGPLAEHVAVAAPALLAAGERDAERAAGGKLVATAADGRTGAVRSAAEADLVVVVEEQGLGLIRTAAARLGEPRRSVDRSISAATVVGEVLDLTGALPALAPDVSRRRAVLAVSAQLLGLADAMVAMATEHVRTRHQFGVPIGSQQAVKHLLARALVSLEHARPVVYQAAWQAASAPHAGAADVAASFAKVYATRAADQAARASLQCHGAVGYSYEHDLHLWMKRVWALATQWGTTADHEERVADGVLDS